MTTVNRPHPPASRRLTGSSAGFTLIEMLTVLFMSAVLGLIITQVVSGTTATTQHLLSETQARSNAHVAMTSMQRALRGARPLGACLDTGIPADKDLTSCRRVGEYPTTDPAHPAIVSATGSDIVFYANDSGSAQRCTLATDPGAALRPAERVEVSVDAANRLVVRRWCPPKDATYTDELGKFLTEKPMTAAPDLVLDGGTVLDRTIFAYTDAGGAQLTPDPTTGQVTSPARIAMVEVTPRFGAGHGRSAADFTADIFVPLSLADPNEGAGQ